MRVILSVCTLCFITALGFPDSELKLLGEVIDNTSKAVTEIIDIPSATTTTAGKDEANADAEPVGRPTHTVADRTRLHYDLFTGYNKDVNPDNGTVKFGLALIDFRVLPDKNVFESHVWERIVWQDDRLTWDKEKYGGVDVLRVNANSLWRPDITLYSSADPVNMVSCWNGNALVYPNGEVLHVPSCKLSCACNFTLSKEPYGEQACSLKFGSWTYDGYAMDVQLYNGTEGTGVSLSDLNNSSGFEITSTSTERVEKYYPCCKEPYPHLNFNITVKRIPGEELFKML